MLRSSKVAVFVLLVLVAGLVAYTVPGAPEPVATLRAGDFARMSYHGRAPRTARVLLQFPARPTADPLVWEYRPSVSGTVPPSIRFHFAEPPAGPFLAVDGTVLPFELDIHRRVSNLPGVAVVTGCRAAR